MCILIFLEHQSKFLPSYCILTGNPRSTSYNASPRAVYLQNDGNSTAAALDNSAPQLQHNTVVGPKLNSSKECEDTTLFAFLQLRRALFRPKVVTPEKEVRAQGETKKMDESGEKGSVGDGVAAPMIPEEQTAVTETICNLEEDKNNGVNQNSSTQNEDQSAKTTESENETSTDQRKSKNVGEDKDIGFNQDKNERSNHVKDGKQVANDPTPRGESSSGSQKSSFSEVRTPSLTEAQSGKNVDGGSKSNENSLGKNTQIDKNTSSEKNKTTTDKPGKVEEASDHREDNQTIDKQKENVTATAGEVNKTEEVN